MNTLILIILILACAYMELSQKCDTNNIFEKLGMGMIVGGAGLELANIHSGLIIHGAAIYFITQAYRAYTSKHDRRKADHTPKRRKILS